MTAIRVVLAEDNALLRQGVEKLITQQDGLELVGTANDLPGLLELVEAVVPDVVVTDIRMPPTGTDEGIQAASRLREHRPSIGVVVLSQYANPEYALALLADGSARRAYLLKESIAGVDELVRAIRTVAEGGSVIDPAVVEALVAASAPRRPRTSTGSPPGRWRPGRRWPRARTTRPSPPRSFLSERAVEKHTNAIFSKLGLTEEEDVNRRVKAVLIYLERPGHGLATPPAGC